MFNKAEKKKKAKKDTVASKLVKDLMSQDNLPGDNANETVKVENTLVDGENSPRDELQADKVQAHEVQGAITTARPIEDVLIKAIPVEMQEKANLIALGIVADPKENDYEFERVSAARPVETAAKILSEAIKTMEVRGSLYDSKSVGSKEERSMLKTVKMFEVLTGVSISEEQGWKFMAVLKLVRSETGNASHKDNYLDGAAYMALAGETALKTK